MCICLLENDDILKNDFNKVMLATDNVNKFSDLAGALRWVFKVFDYKAKGELQVDQVPQLLLALFRYDINEVLVPYSPA